MKQFLDILRSALNENEIVPDNEWTSADEADSQNDERTSRLEKTIRSMCEKEFGWEFDGVSYPVVLDEDNELTITVVDTNLMLEDLEKLKSLGTSIRVSPTQNFRLHVILQLHPGLDISSKS